MVPALLLMWDLTNSSFFFCRLSLQYHPDKNKNKGAQEKFAEINNGIVNLRVAFYLGAYS